MSENTAQPIDLSFFGDFIIDLSTGKRMEPKKRGPSGPREKDLQHKIVEKIHSMIDQCNGFWSNLGQSLPYPKVFFDLSGSQTIWGKVKEWELHINLGYLHGNPEEFEKKLLPCELARMVTPKIYGLYIEKEGPEFQNVCRMLGYESENKRQTRKFRYVSACGRDFRIGLNLHNKIQGGDERRCPDCKEPVTFDSEIEA